MTAVGARVEAFLETPVSRRGAVRESDARRPDWLSVPAAPRCVEPFGGLTAPLRFVVFADGQDPRVIQDRIDRVWSPGLRVFAGSVRQESEWPETEVCHLGAAEGCGARAFGDGSGGRSSIEPSPLNKHALDVALSRGRHAVERAKLAGCGLFVGVACEWDAGGMRLQSPVGESDPYRRLVRCGCREFAALVGAAIAAGQIGIPMLCLGRGGDAALSLVRRLHPGVLAWLAADMPRPEVLGRQTAGLPVRNQLSPASEESCSIGARSCSI
ncbi:hypothetical protein ThidrDRAFT_0363 [Thiorhodococcus drewsii AZ1]|uniref:Uncharacterized protein n=1 Tax=Thiorhodococcus drewsii AZ1 TaxID=765913 RepID=G2DWH4_9GAMM|nr:hypothetical protein ThidrDRAFT_0363 [Thiorhodococcus drewsii AZ1]